MQDTEIKTDGEYWKDVLSKVVNSSWEFATRCVFTKNEVDASNPIARFPAHFDYLKIYHKIWETEPFLAIPKSRRMFMSWDNLVLHLWDAMWHSGRNIAFVSKKEDDADELLSKCEFILKNIHRTGFPQELIPKWKRTFCELSFPEMDSRIGAYPQGADQLRMHTFSRIMADEAAFWDKAKEMYSGAIPTLEGGGKMTMISSPAPGFFKDLVFDRLDGSDALTTPKRIYPMEGVEIWRNPKNKFVVFQLHYSANPDKKDPKYRDTIKSAMPHAQYMQEYELSWETFSGKPVFPDFSKSQHVSKTSITPQIGLPLLLGVDQGLTPACIVCQQQEDTFVVLKEYTAVNMGAERFVDLVKSQLRNDFPEWADLKRDYIVGMDPSGFNRRDTDERTYAAVWAQAGFAPKPGAMNWEPRKQAVEKKLITFHKGKPTFLLSGPDCPMLIKGFEGGYRYPESSFDIQPNKARPIKDENANPQDGLQYVLTCFGKTNRTSQKVPTPGYSFNRPQKGAANGQLV